MPEHADEARRAASAAEVHQRIVELGSAGRRAEALAEFISAHTACDRYLEDSGLPYVIVRPNLFLQNIPESTIPSIDAAGNFYADAGEARISMVDTRDVAAVAAVALTVPGHAAAPATTSPGPRRCPMPTSPPGSPRHWD